MNALNGKQVLVVGGSAGIGLGAALAAAQAGAEVTIASRSAEKLAKAATSIGSGVVTRRLDAADDASVADFFRDGKVWDHVVASAGAGGRGRIADISMADAFTAMNAKFWSYYRVARAVKVASGGSLTFVSGSLGQKSAPGAALISAVNGAVESLTRGLALDFAPIRVNTISPGVVDTALWDRMSASDRKAMFEKSAATLPARRIGQPADIGHAILFMMTNPFITGTVVQVDGGALLGSAAHP